MLDRFTGDNTALVRKLNGLVDAVNALRKISGGPGIQVSTGGSGTVIAANINEIVSRVPKQVAIAAGVMTACLVWQDGGSTDGSKTVSCDRTYELRTLDATSVTTGTQIATDMTPEFSPRTAIGELDTPPATGAGRVGAYYLDADGDVHLWTANEVLDTEVCS